MHLLKTSSFKVRSVNPDKIHSHRVCSISIEGLKPLWRLCVSVCSCNESDLNTFHNDHLETRTVRFNKNAIKSTDQMAAAY